MRFEYLLQEMAECRQDDRDSDTQILSVVAAGIAALVVVINVLSDGGNEQALGALSRYAPLILAGIVTAAFSYMFSLGLRSTLRYRYMRALSDELNSLSGMPEGFMGWTEISAPLITLNPRHVKSVYTAAYFGSVLFAVAAAVAVCASLIAISAAGSPFGLAAGVLMASFFVCFAVAAASVSDSRSMMTKIQSLARERRGAPADGASAASSFKAPAGDWLGFVRYLIYPHPQDLLKVLFVVFGFVWGCFLADSDPLSAQSLCLLALALVVFDALGYQARYQINDIRGYGEDKWNPASGRRGRLSSFGVSEPVAVYASAAAALVKIITGAAIAAFAPVAFASKIALGIAYVLIFVIAAAYEYSRAMRYDEWPFRLVGLGYPLRIGAGVFFALGAHAQASVLASSLSVAIALVLIAAFLFGWSFVGITWLLECCADRYETYPADGSYHKVHVEHLRKMAKARNGGFDPASRYYPLLRHDSVRNVWNWSLVVSAALMLLAAFALPLGLGATSMEQLHALFLLALSAVLLIGGLYACVAKPDKAAAGFAALVVAAISSVVPVVVCCYRGDYLGCACPAVLLATIVYVLICLSFKGVNYFEMADFFGGVRYGATYGVLSAFGRIFRWPAGERVARDVVKQAKKDLEEFNHEDVPEDSGRRKERVRKEQKLEDAFREYVDLF